MPIAIDTETYLIRPGLLAPPLVIMSSFDGGLEAFLRLPKEALTYFRELLANRETIIFHNGAYDLAVLAAYDETLLKPIFDHFELGLFRDTQIRQELLDIAQGRRMVNGVAMVLREGQWVKAEYNLAYLERLHINRDRSAEKKNEDAWRKRYHELDGVPLSRWPEDASRYAKEDAEGTYRVWQAQGLDFLTNEKEQVYAAFCLHLASAWGMRTDGLAVQELEIKLLAAQQKGRRRLIQTGFLEVDKCTKKQKEEGKVGFWAPNDKGILSAYRYKKNTALITDYASRVFKRKGLNPKLSPGGKISTDKDAIEQSGSLLLGLLSDGGGIDKIVNTFLPALKGGTEVPINPRFKVLVNSGRTSSYNPNVQQIPSGKVVAGSRECFVARPGYTIVSVDFDTFELRALAQVCLWLFGESKMAEALIAGRELHADLASELIDVPYEQVMERKGDKNSPEKNARDLAKVGNFGIPGGLGSDSMVNYARANYGVRLSKQKAIRLKQQYLRKWPEMDRYFKYISKLVGIDYGDVKHFGSGRIRGMVDYCAACNSYFQGLAADAAKEALTQISMECYSDKDSFLYGSRVINFIHDEYLVEVPDEVLTEGAERICELARSSASKIIPDVPITCSPAAMKKWYKNATEVRVNGKLVPWEPK